MSAVFDLSLPAWTVAQTGWLIEQERGGREVFA